MKDHKKLLLRLSHDIQARTRLVDLLIENLNDKTSEVNGQLEGEDFKLFAVAAAYRRAKIFAKKTKEAKASTDPYDGLLAVGIVSSIFDGLTPLPDAVSDPENEWQAIVYLRKAFPESDDGQYYGFTRSFVKRCIETVCGEFSISQE